MNKTQQCKTKANTKKNWDSKLRNPQNYFGPSEKVINTVNYFGDWIRDSQSRVVIHLEPSSRNATLEQLMGTAAYKMCILWQVQAGVLDTQKAKDVCGVPPLKENSKSITNQENDDELDEASCLVGAWSQPTPIIHTQS